MGDFTLKIIRRAIITLLAVQLIPPSDGQTISNFAINLYKNVQKPSSLDKNIATSPFSAEAALSMTLAGAAGATKSELATALGIGRNFNIRQVAEKFGLVSAGSTSYIFQSANGLFLEKTYPISPSFRSTIASSFGANISAVDFLTGAEAARTQINSFVEAETNNKIHNFFSAGSLVPDTRLVLVNAIYFKADWDVKFDATQTFLRTFTLASGQQKQAQLMNLEDRFLYTESAELGGAQLLELRYTKGEVSMVVILPSKQSGLKAFEREMTAGALESALGRMSRQKVNAFLPKFKVNTGFDLVNALKDMGVKSAFSDGADFFGISPKKDLKISKVVQKVYVEVDEKGTEAAAATGVQITMLSAMVDMNVPPVFLADRPFLYLIRHNPTKSILFLGRVSDPTVEN